MITMPRCLKVVCGIVDVINDYKLYKEMFESCLENFSILETTEGNRKVHISVCKLCKDVKLTNVSGMNINQIFVG